MRPTRTDEELKKISRDVSYEIVMMQGAAAAFCGVSVSEHVLKNLALEGFLLHLRNLRDFFYSKTAKPDDVLAADFFEDPHKWQSVRPPLATVVEEKRDRLNRQLAHLSYSRLSFQKSWGNIGEMLSEVMKTVSAFLRSLPQEKASWFRRWYDGASILT